MISVLAQAPDFLTPLASAGVGGVCLMFLMWRDVKKDEREAKREEEREKRRVEEMATLVQELRNNTGAIHHLIRSISTEVLTRPHVGDRTRAEMREIQEMIGKGS